MNSFYPFIHKIKKQKNKNWEPIPLQVELEQPPLIKEESDKKEYEMVIIELFS